MSPEDGRKSDKLSGWRREIDIIDRQIIDLLAKRFKITEEIGIFKARNELSAFDANRENGQEKRIDSLSQYYQINPSVTQDIFRLIRDEVKKRHDEIKKESF